MDVMRLRNRLPVFAGLALLLLSGCTVPDDGWHFSSRYRASSENYSLAGLSKRPVPVDAVSEGGEVIYLRRDTNSAVAASPILPQTHFARFGGLERHIPLQAWRGQKMQLSLRLKNDGNALAFAMAQVNRRNGDALRTDVANNIRNNNDWRTHTFVLQVPDDASYLFVYAGFTGNGEFWLEGLRLEAAAADAPLTGFERLPAPGPLRTYEDSLPIMPFFQPNPDPNPPYIPPPEPPPAPASGA
jgi:hypothetical protein